MKKTTFFASALVLAGAFMSFGFTTSKTGTPIAPKVEITLDNIHSGTATTSEIATVSQVRVYENGADATKSVSYTVKGYTLAISPIEGQPYMVVMQSEKVDINTRKRLSHLHAGDKVILAHVKAAKQDGQEANLEGIIYNVVVK
jgi:hypothetical protein